MSSKFSLEEIQKAFYQSFNTGLKEEVPNDNIFIMWHSLCDELVNVKYAVKT